jgi:hypothetical protein
VSRGEKGSVKIGRGLLVFVYIHKFICDCSCQCQCQRSADASDNCCAFGSDSQKQAAIDVHDGFYLTAATAIQAPSVVVFNPPFSVGLVSPFSTFRACLLRELLLHHHPRLFTSAFFTICCHISVCGQRQRAFVPFSFT